MTSSLSALLALARAPRSRLALTIALGTGTVIFGVGLMASAGYLISRVAERPAVLSLVTIVVVAVLEGVSITLRPGEKVALLGASGAGKTTIVNLLRFLDPDAGAVTLGGRDLRECRLADIRRNIAVAGQESHLFSTSIRDNVRLSRPEASDSEVENALRRARIWDWVGSLPDGLDTQVGEQGRELSGGQRQRVVVARALLAGAPVLVLDEPTAHLDPRTATELIDDVLVAAVGQTVLLITQRTEGLERVDRVVTLSRGGGRG